MNKPSIAFLVLALSAAIHVAHAQIYQWKDANGKTVISDTPPPTNVRNPRSVMPGGAVLPDGGDAAKPAVRSVADKELEFRARQKDAREKAEKQSKEETADREKRQACEQARRNIASLESGQRIVTTDDNGEQQSMDATQRAHEMERIQQMIADKCN